jgi:membrane associated rhomboid family serine protease
VNYANFPPEARQREPVFNLPPVLAALLAILAAIHIVMWAVEEWGGREAYGTALTWLAFWPPRYNGMIAVPGALPGGLAADAWTFVTYALLHGNLLHLVFNLLWLLAFGSAVAWRFGALRFLLFCAVTAAAGAGAHLLTNFNSTLPLVGASAAISGTMAASIRFAFEAGGPLSAFRMRGKEAFRVPALPLKAALRNPPVLVFLAVWFALNLFFAFTSAFDGGGDVAWQAHIGGFLAGLLLFPLFDPVPRPVYH